MKNMIILLLTFSLMGCKDDITTIPWTAETHEISRLLNVGKPGSFWVYEDSVNQILDTVYFVETKKETISFLNVSNNLFKKCKDGEKFEEYISIYEYKNIKIKSNTRPTLSFFEIKLDQLGSLESIFDIESRKKSITTKLKTFNNSYSFSNDFYFVKDTGLVSFSISNKNYTLKKIVL